MQNTLRLLGLLQSDLIFLTAQGLDVTHITRALQTSTSPEQAPPELSEQSSPVALAAPRVSGISVAAPQHSCSLRERRQGRGTREEMQISVTLTTWLKSIIPAVIKGSINETLFELKCNAFQSCRLKLFHFHLFLQPKLKTLNWNYNKTKILKVTVF